MDQSQCLSKNYTHPTPNRTPLDKAEADRADQTTIPSQPLITYLPNNPAHIDMVDNTTTLQTYIVQNLPDTPPTSPQWLTLNPTSVLSVYLDKMTLKRTREEMDDQPGTKRIRRQEAEIEHPSIRTRKSPRRKVTKTNPNSQKRVERKKVDLSAKEEAHKLNKGYGGCLEIAAGA